MTLNQSLGELDRRPLSSESGRRNGASPAADLDADLHDYSYDGRCVCAPLYPCNVQSSCSNSNTLTSDPLYSQ